MAAMDFDLPDDLVAYLAELDDFIEREIKPLEQQDDNIRFFDHRREDARTDWDRGGLPNEEWEALLARGPPPRRRRRPLPLPVPEGVRRPGRHEPRHGRDPRALRGEGPRPAQRPAERALDRRQQRRTAADARTTAPRSRRRSGSTTSPLGDARLRVRDHRARPRLGRDAHGDHRRARRRRVGDQRREDVEHGHPQGARTT